MELIIFDCPSATGDYISRMKQAEKATWKSKIARCVVNKVCKSTAEALEILEEVQKRKGEGLMLRNPNITYKAGRTWDLLKMKTTEPR